MLNAELICPGDTPATLLYAANTFLTCCQEAILDHDAFYVALSGGSTPASVYKLLTSAPFAEEIEWEKVHLFWSDERAVPPTSPESNYHMALKAGFEKVNIPPAHIHRMHAETALEKNTVLYEKTIRTLLEDRPFDLVLLGMGEDGHTASLFPDTPALHATTWVTSLFVPQKNSWRMTLTLPCLNAARHAVFFVWGASKKAMLHRVFHTPPSLPCQYVGTPDNPALWIVDENAHFN